jgi:hypothetical protein
MIKFIFYNFILFFYFFQTNYFHKINISGQITDKNNKSIEFLESTITNKIL